MSKILKITGAIVLVLVVVFLVASMLGPKELKMERSIVIHAPVSVVFNNIADYRNFHKWSPWAKLDTTAMVKYEGPQGQADARYRWSGNSKIGEGEMHTTEIAQDLSMVIHLTFLRPFKSEANVTFRTDSIGGGDTRVTWGFIQQSAFVQRPMLLFFNMEKMLAADFDKGLAGLKELSESGAATASAGQAIEVKEIQWEKKTYVVHRLKTSTDSLAALFPVWMPRVYEYIKANNLEVDGAVAGLYYTWDMEKKTTDVAIGIPVKKVDKVSGDYQIVTVGASKALLVDYYGPYDKMQVPHELIGKYIEDKKLNKKAPVIEAYVTDPMVEKDNNKWLTKIIYPVE